MSQQKLVSGSTTTGALTSVFSVALWLFFCRQFLTTETLRHREERVRGGFGAKWFHNPVT